MSETAAAKDSGAVDVERRLSKALRLIDKLRNKYEFEKEVGQELALRNESFKKDLYNETEKLKHAMSAFEELHVLFFDLWKLHDHILSNGMPTDATEVDEMRALLEDQRDTAERLKRFAHPPSAKQKKKGRRMSEVGINIQAETGTSLTRSKAGPTTESIDALASIKFSRKETVTISADADASAVESTTRKSSLILDGPCELDYYSALEENAMTPLFEHFIVVGVRAEKAGTVLEKINKELESSEAVSSRWLRKLGLSKMISSENSPASTTGRSSAHVTPDRKIPSSPIEEASSRDQMWGVPTNLFSSADDGETTRSTFSGSSSKTSTLAKFGKFFGSKEAPPAEATDRSSFFGLKSRRQSTPANSLPDLSTFDEGIKRCDSAPTEGTEFTPDESNVEKHSVCLDEPGEISDVVVEASSKDTDEGCTVGDVFGEDEQSATRPPVQVSPNAATLDGKYQFSTTLSRFGFNKKKPDSVPSSSNMSFGLSFSRLSSSSIAHDDSSDQTVSTESARVRRMPSVEEIASSFLFNDELPKISTPKAAPVVTPSKAAPLVEFSEDLDPDIIYRYPPNVAPPPVEVADFCMPVGAKLYRINPREEETMALKILYSHEGHRSSRCFIFMLEDRTAAASAGDDDDSTARLYGICVVHHRLLGTQKNGANGGPIFEFITPVCYCFITRFPLFDFFFQVIWSMISGERIARMQGVQDHPDDEGYDRKSYSYVPEKTLSEVLFALSKTKPPSFSERIVFSVPSASTVVEHMRLTPPGDMSEHDFNASSWALPCLLDWLSPRTLTWAIGLLLCEVKLIVIGHEPGMVSCAVMSLMALLKPLTWVAPLIPILPLKHMDFIEAPVPIIAGVVLHGEAFSMTNLTTTSQQAIDAQTPFHSGLISSPQFNVMATASKRTINESADGAWHPETAAMLKKCLDSDSLTAVLDLTVADIFVSRSQMKGALECSLPGMQILLDSFEKSRGLSRSPSTVEAFTHSSGPQYSVTQNMREEAKLYQDLLRSHLSEFVDSVESDFKRPVPFGTSAIDEHMENMKVGRDRALSTTRTPFSGPNLESFASFASVDESPVHTKPAVFGDEFSADVEEVTQSLADAVAAALASESVCEADQLIIDTAAEEVDGIVGVSSFPLPENELENKAAFLHRFFQTQILSEYMDELSLGLECLAENEANEDAAAESATTTANPVRSGSLTFAHEPIHLKRNSLDASGSTNKIIGALPRPASIEFTPVGAAKCGRKGRLSMYISGGVDTVTGIATSTAGNAEDILVTPGRFSNVVIEEVEQST